MCVAPVSLEPSQTPMEKWPPGWVWLSQKLARQAASAGTCTHGSPSRWHKRPGLAGLSQLQAPVSIPNPLATASSFIALWVVPSRQGVWGSSLTIGPAVLHHTPAPSTQARLATSHSPLPQASSAVHPTLKPCRPLLARPIILGEPRGQEAWGSTSRSCSGPDVTGRLLQHQGASLEPPSCSRDTGSLSPCSTAALQMVKRGCFGCLRVPVKSRRAPMVNSHVKLAT